VISLLKQVVKNAKKRREKKRDGEKATPLCDISSSSSLDTDYSHLSGGGDASSVSTRSGEGVGSGGSSSQGGSMWVRMKRGREERREREREAREEEKRRKKRVGGDVKLVPTVLCPEQKLFSVICLTFEETLEGALLAHFKQAGEGGHRREVEGEREKEEGVDTV